jgi:NAD(P)-dependent dehydrogenase (short-subunit alcohol dehydrogenase family)
MRVDVPEDIANIILILASDQASFMTGSIIIADGGRLIYNPGSFEVK